MKGKRVLKIRRFISCWIIANLGIRLIGLVGILKFTSKSQESSVESFLPEFYNLNDFLQNIFTGGAIFHEFPTTMGAAKINT